MHSEKEKKFPFIIQIEATVINETQLQKMSIPRISNLGDPQDDFLKYRVKVNLVVTKECTSTSVPRDEVAHL